MELMEEAIPRRAKDSQDAFKTIFVSKALRFTMKAQS